MKNGTSFVFWFSFHWLLERTGSVFPPSLVISHLCFRIACELKAAAEFPAGPTLDGMSFACLLPWDDRRDFPLATRCGDAPFENEHVVGKHISTFWHHPPLKHFLLYSRHLYYSSCNILKINYIFFLLKHIKKKWILIHCCAKWKASAICHKQK